MACLVFHGYSAEIKLKQILPIVEMDLSSREMCHAPSKVWQRQWCIHKTWAMSVTTVVKSANKHAELTVEKRNMAYTSDTFLFHWKNNLTFF